MYSTVYQGPIEVVARELQRFTEQAGRLRTSATRKGCLCRDASGPNGLKSDYIITIARMDYTMSDQWEFFPCTVGESQTFIFVDVGIKNEIAARVPD